MILKSENLTNCIGRDYFSYHARCSFYFIVFKTMLILNLLFIMNSRSEKKFFVVQLKNYTTAAISYILFLFILSADENYISTHQIPKL